MLESKQQYLTLQENTDERRRLCRKSTQQEGIADEQRSVAQQVEHAMAYARGKGWHRLRIACVHRRWNQLGGTFERPPSYSPKPVGAVPHCYPRQLHSSRL